MTNSVPGPRTRHRTIKARVAEAGVVRAGVVRAGVAEAGVVRAGVVRAGVANAVGAYGERLAARYLTDLGMAILDRNRRCDQGEIDIVAMDESCLVIVEVKTRRSLSFGSPVEAVTAVKAARLRRLAGCWMADHRSLVASVADVRIDVIGVLRPSHGPAQIEHMVSVAA